ncbi:hypothetical protein GO988_19825 [Hymenobacter sp. HMF4947]|uniref:Uncharacterized protein n=1 Tax=Hymenobacter ginkgonis TaxID=2682976 RepID=A0A7K1TJK3_9BACT|nr:hypothetical protein [Hymenobacter ginkgonis]MVN78587.1 hypothetical protein [Hymenobacter ginkgonis]
MRNALLAVGLLKLLGVQTAAAQVALPPTAKAADGFASANYSFGYAEMKTVTGKVYPVYVPLARYGFSHELPLFRQESDMQRLDAEPQSILVDRVASVQTTDAYFEHVVLAGKPQHVLAVRTVSGPVELFSYVETKRIHMGGGGGLRRSIGYVPYLPKQHWYLRQQGTMTEVLERNFVQQMTAYFASDPAVGTGLAAGTWTYQTLSALVVAHNQRLVPAGQ